MVSGMSAQCSINCILYFVTVKIRYHVFFQHVMQITHFHIEVQKYDLLYLWSVSFACLLCLFADLGNFAKLNC